MRLFQKSIALILSVLMLFSLVACDTQQGQEDSLGESSFAESLTSREENKPSDTESSLPAETDEPSDEGSDVSEEEDDVSLPEVSHDPAVLQAYEETFEAFRDADSFSLTLSVSTEKYVGIALITETTNATAKFAGLHTDTPTAQIITKYANVSVESAGFTATESQLIELKRSQIIPHGTMERWMDTTKGDSYASRLLQAGAAAEDINVLQQALASLAGKTATFHSTTAIISGTANG
jgi:hypothetical protein